MKWYLKAIKKYSDISGRARRKEFWIFQLLQIPMALLVIIQIVIIDHLHLSDISSTTEYWDFLFMLFLLCIGLIIVLIIILWTIASLAITVRRLHDIGMSGAWILIILIPYIGAIFLSILLFFIDSQPGTNRWGKNPKGIKAFYDNDVEQK